MRPRRRGRPHRQGGLLDGRGREKEARNGREEEEERRRKKGRERGEEGGEGGERRGKRRRERRKDFLMVLDVSTRHSHKQLCGFIS